MAGWTSSGITAPREIVALLKQFQDGNLLLNLNGSNGAMLSTTLWSLDPTRGQLSFSADALAPMTQRLVECDEAVAVGYLDSIKVQFDVQGLVLVRGGRQRDQRAAAARAVPLPAPQPSAVAPAAHGSRWRACATR